MLVSKRYIGFSVLLLTFFLLFISLPAYNLWWDEVFNSGHALLFLIFTCLLYQKLKIQYRQLKTSTLYVGVFILAVLTGALIEALQGLVNREPSVADLLANVYGVLAGLCFVSLFNNNERRRLSFRQVCFTSGLLLFLALGIAPLLQLSWHYVARDRAFPVVLNLDASWSSSFVQYSNSRLLDVPTQLASTEDSLHLIQFDAGQYPGFALIEPVPDWSHYSRLRFNIVSKSKNEVEIVLRVHDKRHNQQLDDRYNKVLLIHPGFNTYVISLDKVMHGPMGRKLDLTQVSELRFFAVNREEPVQLAISNLLLE